MPRDSASNSSFNFENQKVKIIQVFVILNVFYLRPNNAILTMAV